MPVIQKEDVQKLLFNTLKSMLLLQKEKESPGRNQRLQALKAFKDRLIEFGGPDIRKTPNRGELNRYAGIPDGQLPLFTFPGEPEVTIEETPDETEVVATAPTPVSPTTTVTPTSATPTSAPTPQARATPSYIPQAVPTPPGARSFSGGTLATLARPKVGQQEKERLPLKELQDYRRRLQRADMSLVRQSAGKTGAALEKIQKDRDQVNSALNAAISLERQRYEAKPSEKPDDWGNGQPKNTTWDKLKDYPAIDVNKLPDALKFAEQSKRTFAKEPGEVPGGKGKGQRFVNTDIRRVINDISAAQRELDKLNPQLEGDRAKIEGYEKNVDALKDRLRYMQSIKNIGIESQGLSQEHDQLADRLKGYLNPQQLKDYQAGKQIDIAGIGDRQGFMRTLREYGRELDKINQSLNDEFAYVQADPSHTVQEFRAMPLDERKYILEDVKRDQFMQKIASGVEDYYNARRKGKESFDELAPEAQQAWTKRFAASEARKGAPGMSGADISKFLFGGGEHFVSKYPPELYGPMVRAARTGFSGMEQANRRIGALAMQDPNALLYGLNAPQQQHFATGQGQAPMVPQLPQEYAFTPQQMMHQPQTQQPINLPQLLQQGMQQAPQPVQPNTSDQVEQLISQKLANLLGQGGQ